MQKLVEAFVGAALAVGVMAFGVGTASAHNHAFTPLGCLTTDNPNSGATVGFVQASDAAPPMQGPTAIIAENASGKLPTGGEGAENACK
jgi:hypothetical protein